ncbi:hypothetical protein ILUMI_11280 [Ignelater luminosus]|uniref:Uncharacterized protein n=1 Tax=Ignelater luminosus TaxID=2038154 RepID=A0A8K0CWJ1_IGNLU|nr:hypothetical protein ILUMI_11280 [Ignelater luminosus]
MTDVNDVIDNSTSPVDDSDADKDYYPLSENSSDNSETEDIATSRSKKIGSVLLKLLNDVSGVDELIIFRDNCPGQKKNWTLMSLWLQLIKEKKK